MHSPPDLGGGECIAPKIGGTSVMQNFRTLHLALRLARETALLDAPGHLRNQLCRAADSVALNLGEGYGRLSKPDQRRFYRIALGSLREVQVALALCGSAVPPAMLELADALAAHLWRLIHPR
jgi:four helix bundle protein